MRDLGCLEDFSSSLAVVAAAAAEYHLLMRIAAEGTVCQLMTTHF